MAMPTLKDKTMYRINDGIPYRVKTAKNPKSPCINCEPISTNLCCYCESPNYEMFEPKGDNEPTSLLRYKVGNDLSLDHIKYKPVRSMLG